ncbi:hypothetical protein Aduo_016123 [Ancylostoma duodenale]
MSNMAERLQHQEIVLDMEVQDDRETALMLLEDLRLYPDIEYFPIDKAIPDYARHIIADPKELSTGTLLLWNPKPFSVNL